MMRNGTYLSAAQRICVSVEATQQMKKKKKKRGKIGKGDFREGGKNYKKENKKKMVECRWSGPIRAQPLLFSLGCLFCVHECFCLPHGSVVATCDCVAYVQCAHNK